MAKKKTIEDKTRYVSELLEDIMGAGFGRYAKYVIQERALPDARDGLKPVQRRILYAMYHDGNTWDRPYRKSAKTVGLVIGNYHPHGDTSVYDAMVRMSQDWKVRLPLIDMHGNNGSIDDDPAAAMRYTEVRLAKITQVMQDDLDKNTVEMAPNFDDTDTEPTVLPVPFPVMLVNGASGIAAGYATNMPPHNLGEVIDAAVYRIQNPECSLSDIMDIMPGPDFPTGGIVQGEDGIRDAFETGQGRIVIRSKCEIIETKQINQIVITEIPYEVIKGQLVHKMDEIRITRQIDGLLDVRDESDRNGLRIVVDVKKETDANMVLNYLYKNTELQRYYSYNNVTIIDQTPVLSGVFGLLDAFIAFRREVVLRRSRYELDRMEARCHIIEGLMRAVSVLDEVIRIIRHSKDKADAKKNLMKEFRFDEPQSEAIVSLRLYRLTNTDITVLREEFAQLVNRIEEMRAILENANVLDSVIIRELRAVKKEYASPRRTKIESKVEDIVIDRASMVTSERVMVTVSRDGYIKRVSLRSFNASNNAETGIKDTDVCVGFAECDTLDTLLLFTSRGNYAFIPVWQIEEAKWKDIGPHLNKNVRIAGDDKIISALLVRDFDTYAWIVTVSSAGQIKRTPVSAFRAVKNNRVMTAMSLPAGAQMISAAAAYEDSRIIAVSRDGFSYTFPISQIPVTGVRSKGVKLMNLSKGDKTGYAGIMEKNASSAVFITDTGAMKRVRISEIPEGTRPMKGNLICRKVKTSPSRVIYACGVIPSAEIICRDPLAKQIRAADIPVRPASAGFSTPLELKKDFIVYTGIPECRIIDIPEGADTSIHDDVEKISLFDQEES